MPSKQASSRRLFGDYLSAGPRADTAGAAPQTRERRSFLALMTYFSRMIHGQRGRIALALAALTLSTLLKLLLPPITKLSVDLVFTDNGSALSDWLPLPTDRIHLLVLLGLAGFAAGVFGRAIRIGAQWCTNIAGLRVVAATRRTVFRHALALPLDRLQRLKSGGAVSLLRDDALVGLSLIDHLLYSPWQAILQLAGSVALLAWTDWPMLLGFVVVLPCVYWVHRSWMRRLWYVHRDIRAEQQDIDGHVTEVFGGVRVVRAYRRERGEARRFVARNHLTVRQEVFAWWRARAVDILWGAFLPAVSAVFLIYGGLQVLHGELTLGDLMMFLVLIAAFLEPLSSLANNVADLPRDLARLDRLADVLAMLPEEIAPPGAPAVDRARLEGRLRLRGVNFCYPGSERLVLRGIDLEVRPGQVVALVGVSGAGKTTLSNLAAGFYDPTAGAVELDGVDLRRLDRHSYRALLGIVEQDIFLFDGTVAENISYGAPTATPESIRHAARLADADEFIAGLPQGYDTVIGERGVRLSGGQRQRLAIARAALPDPRIVIWDEATSNLDSESEHAIHQNCRDLANGRICFVIAHRQSTIAHADVIVVLEDGRVVESGTHAELLRASGRYRRMIGQQVADRNGARDG